MTAHTELVLETNTSSKPRQAACKREGQEWVTGTPGARDGAQNRLMNGVSVLAGVCGYSLAFQPLLSVYDQVRPRETNRNSL